MYVHFLDALFRTQTLPYMTGYTEWEYETTLINFKKEGMGRERYQGEHPNEVLVTEWHEGVKSGSGFIYNTETKKVTHRLFFENNKQINKEFIVNDDKTTGIVADEDGSRWEGDIVNGCPCGEGRLYDADNNLIYEGTFIDGAYEGFGISYYDNGYVSYEGEWCRGMHHGNGIVYNRHGEKEVEGLFLNNSLTASEITIRSYPDCDKLSTLTEMIYFADGVLNQTLELDLYECRRLRVLKIGNNSCKAVHNFTLRHLRNLKSVEIGDNCFMPSDFDVNEIPIDQRTNMNSTCCSIFGCLNLEEIKIGNNCFNQIRRLDWNSKWW